MDPVDANVHAALPAESGGNNRDQERIIVDVHVKNVADFGDPQDYETLAALCLSYDKCTIPMEELLQGTPSLGFEFSRPPDFFKAFLQDPSSQLLELHNSTTGEIEGAALYLTQGSLPQELEPYAADLERAAGRPIKNCAFVKSAWITEPARQDRLYPGLTGRMMEEIFDRYQHDFALAYYRENPSPNTAIKAHMAMGWEVLEFTTTQVFNPFRDETLPSEPKDGYREAENHYREALIDHHGGLRRRYLIYSRERWEQMKERLLNSPHTFFNEDDPQFFPD